jgi:hypothetical protein
MAAAVSQTKILLARLVVVLLIAFVAAGLVWYGFSAEVRARVWQNLLDRPRGPMTFRFFLQPIMAAIAALYDGVNDARTLRAPYFWTMLTKPAKVGGRLHEGLVSTARILLLGLCMDVIYQVIVFKTFHPAEAAIVAFVLGFVPYLALRGPVARIASRWRRDKTANEIR